MEGILMRKKSIAAIVLCLATVLTLCPVTALADSAPGTIDCGKKPIVLDLDQMTRVNPNFRAIVWTGEHLQLGLMSITDEIGMEVHPDEDQFFYIAEGTGNFAAGPDKENMVYCKSVEAGSGVFVPAGTWHNITNTGSAPLKLFTIYAPPHHPPGTIHETREIAEAEEGH
jgi:mannose-6-phosphate isomerase-like protein (cupin superfamily)